MYLEYFGFIEAPFSIAPDPRYLYLSQRHREALAHLLYGIKGNGGFVLLTGEVGSGKTTVCRCLLEQIPEDIDVAYVFNPKLTRQELLSTICDELRIRYLPRTTSSKAFIDMINARLLESNARGRKTVLIIDEAQNLSDSVLELLRLLTNLETSRHKLLQIILIGQPELRARLAQPGMRQLAQRIVARYHLGPLSADELASYVSHRIALAGVTRNLFPLPVLKRLYRLTRGTPRLINVICDRALLGSYVQGRESVDQPTLNKAAQEVLGHAPLWQRMPRWMIAAILLAGVAGGIAAYQALLPQSPFVAAQQAPGSPSAANMPGPRMEGMRN